MHRFIDPWESLNTRDAGWLAGIYDGEGYLSTARQGFQMGVSQKPGLVLDYITRTLGSLGFLNLRCSPTGDGSVTTLQLLGGWREILRLLGSVRPIRLLAKFEETLNSDDFSKQMDGKEAPTEIVKCYDEGEDWCSGLETSTRTYLCEGFGAHNSVAQHSVYVSNFLFDLAAADGEFPTADIARIALVGLLHDASEAYVQDLVRPIKYLLGMDVYHDLEDSVIRAVFRRYGLDPWLLEQEWLKLGDNTVLATEKRDMIPMSPKPWAPLPDPMRLRIEPVPPPEAEKRFLEQFHYLAGMMNLAERT